jgi:peptidoglycan/xylan/chitin deacetylase (PgdA/CDA1 family)
MDYNISSEKLEHPLLKNYWRIIPVFQKLEIKFFVIGATARISLWNFTEKVW